jgi:hypothetical protein
MTALTIARRRPSRHVIDRLASADERTTFTKYQGRRNAHGLDAYHDTVRFAADLRALET